jgi:nucleotide-binding universal stress UspA family protein
LLGSIAEAIVRHSVRPILLVRDKAPWPVKKILLPVEIGPEAEVTVRTGIEVAKGLGATLHLFHVLTLPDFFAIAGDLPKDKQTDFLNLIRQKADEDLKAMTLKHASATMTSSIGIGPVVEEISAQAASLKCDMVIVPTHARHGADHWLHGSTAGQILRYAPCPVMSFAIS